MICSKTWAIDRNLQGKTCLYNGSMAKYNDVSERLGYGLNTAKMPKRVVIMNSGCERRRIQRPPTYPPKCSQNTPKKNSRNESNISIKKYHQSPTFGVKSGRRRCTPYVDDRYSDEPVRTLERCKNHAMLAENADTYVATG